MFETLEAIRSSWNASKFIVIRVKNGLLNFLALPSQAIRPDHFEILSKTGISDYFVALPFEFFREISLPTRFVVYKGIASRYPVISKLIHSKKNKSNYQGVSLSIDHINSDSSNSFENKAKTIQKIGELADEFSHHKLKGEKLFNEFTTSFVSPGPITLMRGYFGLLTKKQTFVELALALAEISNQAPSVFLGQFEGKTTGLNLDEINQRVPVQVKSINDKTILDLWRSIKKIDKTEFDNI